MRAERRIRVRRLWSVTQRDFRTFPTFKLRRRRRRGRQRVYASRERTETVSFDTGLAKKLGLISTGQNRVLLTTVAMSMAATPFVAQLGDTIAKTRRVQSRQ